MRKLLPAFAGQVVMGGLLLLALGSPALAEDQPPAAPPPDADKVRALEDELGRLRQSQQDMQRVRGSKGGPGRIKPDAFDG